MHVNVSLPPAPPDWNGRSSGFVEAGLDATEAGHGCTGQDCAVGGPLKTSPFYPKWYFAPHLQQAGYTVGIFGKHLNNANPVHNDLCCEFLKDLCC